MRHCFFTLVIIHLSFSVLSQTAASSSTITSKPIIDSAAIVNWADLLYSKPNISSNGKYFMYDIQNLPAGSKTLVIQSTKNSWKKEFIGAETGFFSGNSKLAVFKKRDSLYLLSLGKDKVLSIGDIASYKKPDAGAGQWLAYVTKTNELTLQNLLTDKKQRYQNVWDYQFNNDGQVLLMKKKIKIDSLTSERVEWINLLSSKQYTVWQTDNDREFSASGFSFDEAGRQLAFLVQSRTRNQAVNAVWYYKEGTKAIEKVSNKTPGIDSGMILSSNAPSFSKSGMYIFFDIQSIPKPPPSASDPKAVQVDVWSYRDLVLQSLQIFFNKKNQEIPQPFIKTQFTSAIEIDNNHITQLENDTQKVVSKNLNTDFVITTPYQNHGDKTWFSDQKNSFYLTSLKDGTRKYLATGIDIDFFLTSNKKFLIYFDSELHHYMSYNIENGTSKNLTESIPTRLTVEVSDEYVTSNSIPAGIAGWFENGGFLVRDNYDLWMIDPSGQNPPENITNGYGGANQIKFDLIQNDGVRNENTILPTNKPLVLTAFWVNTKQNGFFRLEINKKKNPQLLSVHSCLIYANSKQTDGVGLLVSKAKADNADVWIVKKQTMADAPNFYSTGDFKSFKQLTNLQPQKKYRWATSELMTWKMLDGKTCQGILYKPEDFDSTKKYPVIIYYYEKFSGTLHQFLRPGFIDGALNIPWFVSRGYLVFKPDIHYTVGSVAKSVVTSVIPGVRELLKLPFVDSSSLGLQGHSFGGYETNVLVTESNLFAAAVEGAGASDLVSHYGSLLPSGRNNGQGTTRQEKGGQGRMDGLLWQDRNAYIENSPIFKADKVTTPLLIFHNKGDEAVPWGQAVELFIALRRLEKPAWMLQYDQGGHGVNETIDQMDYTTRMTQFFNHFLKGAPAPKWMTQGIPASMKGIETGYDLDPAGNCGKECKICKKWNEQWNKASASIQQQIKKEWEKL